MVERLLEVEVAYAKSEQQVIVSVDMPEGTTVQQALKASGLLERFPEIDADDLNVGIFGAVCKPEQLLKGGEVQGGKLLCA